MDRGRRLRLELCSLYQGQQGDVSQSVHGNYDESRFRGVQNLSAVECGSGAPRGSSINR